MRQSFPRAVTPEKCTHESRNHSVGTTSIRDQERQLKAMHLAKNRQKADGVFAITAPTTGDFFRQQKGSKQGANILITAKPGVTKPKSKSSLH